MKNNLYLAHHGIEGQKWGIRRYQNEDGSLTPKGRRRSRLGLAVGVAAGGVMLANTSGPLNAIQRAIGYDKGVVSTNTKKAALAASVGAGVLSGMAFSKKMKTKNQKIMDETGKDISKGRKVATKILPAIGGLSVGILVGNAAGIGIALKDRSMLK